MGLLVSSCPPEIAHPKKFLSLSSALEVITFINHDIHGNTFLVLLRVRKVPPTALCTTVSTNQIRWPTGIDIGVRRPMARSESVQHVLDNLI